MEKYTTQNIRNIIFVSHSGSGKTSLVEALLFDAKMTTRLGKVAEGNTHSDYNADEIERKISITSKFLHLIWKNTRIHILDTPGYADFVGDVIAPLRAADAAVLLIEAVHGIEVGTERAWQFLEEKSLPRAIFINKLDKENASFENTLNSIRDRFGKHCVALNYPIGEQKSVESVLSKDGKLKEDLLDAVVETDDALTEKYLEGKELTAEEIMKALKAACVAGKIIPVFCGSAVQNIGVTQLLDAIVDLLPSPADRPAAEGIHPKTKEPVKRDPVETEPFSAFIFKDIFDPYVGHLTLFRVFSGTIESNTGFYNSTRDLKERIGQLYLLQGKEQIPVQKAAAGDIAAVAKLKDSHNSDTICDEKSPILFAATVFPEPCISDSVKPKTRQDEEKIMGTLTRLASEDPTFKISRDEQTKELVISGMGDLHLDVMLDRMKKRFGVDVEVGTPKVPYKETIKKPVKIQGKFKRQSGGRGQYGDCWLELEPLPHGKQFEFVDKVVGGAIPRQYIPSVEKGVREAMTKGFLAGYPVVDIRVTVYDGSFHEVDSSDMAFQIAGSMAFKNGQEQAGPVLLEPIMDVEIIVPNDYLGQITGDINSRRGRIMGIEGRGKQEYVKASIPLAEMFKYATELRSMTGGRGSYSMKFNHYEEVPAKITQTIVANAKKAFEEAHQGHK
ncbi:MAG: elongation factor G [Omnitrophica WOR_2 bacterium RIFCSPLOWO2_12_FULL_51_24]|nr:MAG: elongation factor G [Omnitrophica WOR_2 bacterium RIFCSPHIGHO2_01_FULL_49_10]OGX34290.1 MAG: elongation factor G [Omnitrophica WOR_2 bacterium RIFCSPLOWO2_02_FULL_50_19]OGX42524.1 MAG: elongation factor G [Omnitrophica WOR_2 bacterium RIFCSPLOWO2_12_FULL_51_24]